MNTLNELIVKEFLRLSQKLQIISIGLVFIILLIYIVEFIAKRIAYNIVGYTIYSTFKKIPIINSLAFKILVAIILSILQFDKIEILNTYIISAIEYISQN